MWTFSKNQVDDDTEERKRNYEDRPKDFHSDVSVADDNFPKDNNVQEDGQKGAEAASKSVKVAHVCIHRRACKKMPDFFLNRFNVSQRDR